MHIKILFSLRLYNIKEFDLLLKTELNSLLNKSYPSHPYLSLTLLRSFKCQDIEKCGTKKRFFAYFKVVDSQKSILSISGIMIDIIIL